MSIFFLLACYRITPSSRIITRFGADSQTLWRLAEFPAEFESATVRFWYNAVTHVATNSIKHTYDNWYYNRYYLNHCFFNPFKSTLSNWNESDVLSFQQVLVSFCFSLSAIPLFVSPLLVVVPVSVLTLLYSLFFVSSVKSCWNELKKSRNPKSLSTLKWGVFTLCFYSLGYTEFQILCQIQL